MGIMEIIGIAGSISLLAGWRLYLCIFATGLAMRMEVVPLPEHLASLDDEESQRWLVKARGGL